MSSPLERDFSAEYRELDSDGKRRYVEKLNLIGENSADPYLAAGQVGEDLSEILPHVEYPDIYNYLITAPSPVTKEALKAYKSLEGYKYLVAGWVGSVSAYEGTSSGRVVVVKAKVRHSQSVSLAPLQPWIAADKSGTIICAHCNCKAGLAESCSHIAALLFALDSHTRIVNDTSCTSQPCQWLPPNMQAVEYTRVEDIDFTAPSRKRIMSPQASSSATSAKSITSTASAGKPSPGELGQFYKQLFKVGKPAVLSIVPQFCESYIPRRPAHIPPPLTSLYDPALLGCTYPQVLDKCEDLFSGISVSEAEAHAIEVNTREQASSTLWFECRAGRVTASRFKSAVRTDPHQPSESLVKTICYPESVKFSTAATRWGCEHERSAISEYKKAAQQQHDCLKVSESGLVVHPKYPFLGASPDGLVDCECCSSGVLEVKCPYSCRGSDVDVAVEDRKFCLGKEEDGQYFLKKDHAYYYQVQLQIFLCSAKYCDFIVYTGNAPTVVRVQPDEEFMTSNLEAVTKFFKLCVLPELAAKFFSKTFAAPLSEVSVTEPAAGATTASASLSAATISRNSSATTSTTALSSAVGSVPAPAPFPTSSTSTSSTQPASGVCHCKQDKASATVMCGSPDCPIRLFHMSCLRMKSAPKHKWFCPECRRKRRQSKASSKV